MKKQSSAKDLLKEIVKKRNWYAGTDITKRDAWHYKHKDISEATAAETLNKLGWVQTAPPTWEKLS